MSHETRRSQVLLALFRRAPSQPAGGILFGFVVKCLFMKVQTLQAASRGKGPPLARSRPGPRGCSILPPAPPSSQARAPLQAAAPPPPAPSETNAAHGGLYGARRQRVARLTLRGKFGGGRQGALMRGPPAPAAARGGGAAARGKREPGSGAATPPPHPTPTHPPDAPTPATGPSRQVEGAGSTHPAAHHCPWLLPRRHLHFLPCQMGPTPAPLGAGMR